MRNKSRSLNFIFGPLAIRTVSAALSMLLLSLFIPDASPAVSLSGDSSTYLQSREAADKTKILGGYEYLDFAVQDLGKDTISFHTGGWLRYDFKRTELGNKSSNDLQYSYLSFKSKTDNTIINLGRVMVFEGVAAERVDGLYARTDLKAGFGISAFGGSPVETAFDLPGNNMIVGGRLSHQVADVYQIGISGLKEEKDSLEYRKEGAVDLWLHPMSKVDLVGRSSYNEISQGWMEHTYALIVGPIAKLRFDTTASWINYDDYFFGATTSALSVSNNGLLLDDENVRILGEAASYSMTDKVIVTADFKNYQYELRGKANYYGGTIKYSAPEAGGFGIGYHCMAGEADRLKYSEYRVYGYKKFGKLDVTADLIEVAYASAINDVKNSYSGSLAAQYKLAETWNLGADLEYSRNPDFNKDIRAFIKLLYHFGAKGGA